MNKLIILASLVLTACAEDKIQPIIGGKTKGDLIWENVSKDIRVIVVSKGEKFGLANPPSKFSNVVIPALMGKSLIEWKTPNNLKHVEQFVDRFDGEKLYFVYNLSISCVDFMLLEEQLRDDKRKEDNDKNLEVYLSVGMMCYKLK